MKKYIAPETIFKNLIQKNIMLDLFNFSDVMADLGEEEETESQGEK